MNNVQSALNYVSLIKDLKLEDFDTFKLEAYNICETALATLQMAMPSSENPAEIRKMANDSEAWAANVVVLWVLADAYLDLATAKHRVTKEANPKLTEDDRKALTDAAVVQYRTIRNLAERIMDIIKSRVILATKNMSLLEKEFGAQIAGTRSENVF
jgi:hypothetical protein